MQCEVSDAPRVDSEGAFVGTKMRRRWGESWTVTRRGRGREVAIAVGSPDRIRGRSVGLSRASVRARRHADKLGRPERDLERSGGPHAGLRGRPRRRPRFHRHAPPSMVISDDAGRVAAAKSTSTNRSRRPELTANCETARGQRQSSTASLGCSASSRWILGQYAWRIRPPAG